MIRLYIKGHFFDAREAAEQRNIPIFNLLLSDNGRETITECQDEFDVSIHQWFNEPSTLSDGGYVAGTLLFFKSLSK